MHNADTAVDNRLSQAAIKHQAPGERVDVGAKAEAILSVGLRVQVTGVKTMPDLNGQFGVCEWYDSAKRRWRVRLESGVVFSLRPSALLAAAADPRPLLHCTALCTALHCTFFTSTAL